MYKVNERKLLLLSIQELTLFSQIKKEHETTSKRSKDQQ